MRSVQNSAIIPAYNPAYDAAFNSRIVDNSGYNPHRSNNNITNFNNIVDDRVLGDLQRNNNQDMSRFNSINFGENRSGNYILDRRDDSYNNFEQDFQNLTSNIGQFLSKYGGSYEQLGNIASVFETPIEKVSTFLKNAKPLSKLVNEQGTGFMQNVFRSGAKLLNGMNDILNGHSSASDTDPYLAESPFMPNLGNNVYAGYAR